MPITVTFTATKPAGTTFFTDVDASSTGALARHKQAIEALPGFISTDVVEVDENTRIQTLVFDTVENYANYILVQSNADIVHERVSYNNTHGITVVVTETIT